MKTPQSKWTKTLNEIEEDFKDLILSTKREVSVDSRLMDFMTKANQIIYESSLTELMDQRESTKVVLKIVAMKIVPGDLRERVLSRMKMESINTMYKLCDAMRCEKK
jgi:hypothetical protein